MLLKNLFRTKVSDNNSKEVLRKTYLNHWTLRLLYMAGMQGGNNTRLVITVKQQIIHKYN